MPFLFGCVLIISGMQNVYKTLVLAIAWMSEIYTWNQSANSSLHIGPQHFLIYDSI
jgi:hypothetical protein